jgi:hypothetical protein
MMGVEEWELLPVEAMVFISLRSRGDGEVDLGTVY